MYVDSTVDRYYIDKDFDLDYDYAAADRLDENRLNDLDR